MILALSAIIGTSIGLARSIASERRARTEAAIAASVNEFLNDDLLAAVSPDELGRDVAMRQVVAVAARRIEGRFQDQPLVEASVRLTLGRTLRSLAELSQAQPHLVRALTLRESLLGPDDSATLEAVHELAMWNLWQDSNVEAEKLFRKAFEGRTRRLSPDDPATISSAFELSVALGEQGRFDESLPLMTRAVDDATRLLGPAHKSTILWSRGLALLYREQGNMDHARELLERTFATARQALGQDNTTTLLCMNDLAGVAMAAGRCSEARDLLRDALEISRRIRGNDHPATASIARSIAAALRCLKLPEEARPALLDALSSMRRAGPAGDRVSAELLLELGAVENELEPGTGEPRLVEGAETLIRLLGDSNPASVRAIQTLIRHYTEAGNPDAPARWSNRLSSPR